MKGYTKAGWICWGISLALSVAGAFLLPAAYNACFAVAVLGLLIALIMTGVILRSAGVNPDIQSALIGWPLTQVVIGVLVIQTLIGLLLIGLSHICPWLVAAIVDCLVLTIDAAVLTRKTEESAAESNEANRE